MSGRKCKGFRVLESEGYGKNQPKNGSLIEEILCRFNFPKFPLDKTEILYPILVSIDTSHCSYYQLYLTRTMKIKRTQKIS